MPVSHRGWVAINSFAYAPRYAPRRYFFIGDNNVKHIIFCRQFHSFASYSLAVRMHNFAHYKSQQTFLIARRTSSVQRPVLCRVGRQTVFTYLRIYTDAISASSPSRDSSSRGNFYSIICVNFAKNKITFTFKLSNCYSA